MPRIKTGLRRNGLLSLSTLLVMALLFVALSFVCGGFSKVPLLIVFLCTSFYSLLTLRGLHIEEKLRIFSRGAGDSTLLLMVWIFMLAGAFAASAKAMGAIDAAVALCTSYLPAQLLLPGIFLVACFISLSIGTSVGTIVALVPIAAGMAVPSGLPETWLVATVVGGAFFGDNLSFISDTTVVATQSQGCRMKDKFLMNLRIAVPAALITLLIYVFMGMGTTAAVAPQDFSFWLVLPYLAVIVLAVMGLNVLLVLTIGLVLTGIIGLLTGGYDLTGWLEAICSGVGSMGELIFISMLAGGLLSVIRAGGGISYLIRRITKHVASARGALLSIAALVGLTNLCTANNTVAILSVGTIAKDISLRFNADPRRTASVLDTASCIVQGMLPYGAQLLMAAGLSSVAPTEIIPFLFYPMTLCATMLISIFLQKGKNNLRNQEMPPQ